MLSPFLVLLLLCVSNERARHVVPKDPLASHGARERQQAAVLPCVSTDSQRRVVHVTVRPHAGLARLAENLDRRRRALHLADEPGAPHVREATCDTGDFGYRTGRGLAARTVSGALRALT